MIISIMGGGRVLHDISIKDGPDNKPLMAQVMKDGKPEMVEIKVPVKGEDGKPVMAPVMKDGKPVLKEDGTPSMAPKLETKQVPKMEPECYVSFELGALIVALTVTSIVFFGGMRGTVWVNIFQTFLFLCFGIVAVIIIGHNLPKSFSEYVTDMASNEKFRALVTREKMTTREFWSYSLIPLSAVMFPHMSIMFLSARKVSAYKRTVVLYPLAIMAIWLPSVFLGVLASQTVTGVQPGAEDGVLLLMLKQHAPALLAGILGAGIISAVMGSDCHQVLALSTMFTKDVFQYYGGKEKYGEKSGVWFARAFILVLTAIAYLVAINTTTGIFELAIRFAFSGFAAMAPVMVGALFWKRSTKWGALASTLYVAACLIVSGILQYQFKSPAGTVIWSAGEGKDVIHYLATAPVTGDVRVWGFMTVVPMVLGSAVCMVIGSLLTRPPSQETIDRYFSPANKEISGSTTSAAAKPAAAPVG
jgi:SSS family solute:Na+ symporter